VPSTRTLLNEATTWPPEVASVTPDTLVLRIRTLSSVRLTVAPAATSTPCWVNSPITTSSTRTEDAWTTRMPSIPVRVPAVPTGPVPLMLSPRTRTERCGSSALGAMLTVTPVVPTAPPARIDA
jgi:hypothetical protein